MKRVLFACFMGIFLVSCSNVKDYKFSKDNKDQIIEKVKKSRDLTGEEVALLMAALLRSSLSGKDFEGKTVGQIIEEQRKLAVEQESKEKEAKRLAEEALRKEAQVAAELSKYLMVTPFKKSFLKSDYRSGNYEDTITIGFVFENKGDKDIRAFKGTTVFKNLFGDKIKEIPLIYDQGIKSGEKKNWYGSLKYNQFMSEDQKLRNTELENMKFEWKSKAIMFKDGSKIGIEDKE